MGKQVKMESRKVHTLNQVGMAMAFYNSQVELAMQNCYHEKPDEISEEYRVSKDQLIGMFMNLSALQTLCIGMLQMGIKDMSSVEPNDRLDQLLDRLVAHTAKDSKRYEQEQAVMLAGIKMNKDKTVN